MVRNTKKKWLQSHPEHPDGQREDHLQVPLSQQVLHLFDQNTGCPKKTGILVFRTPMKAMI